MPASPVIVVVASGEPVTPVICWASIGSDAGKAPRATSEPLVINSLARIAATKAQYAAAIPPLGDKKSKLVRSRKFDLNQNFFYGRVTISRLVEVRFGS
jgi:hypothetical protein